MIHILMLACLAPQDVGQRRSVAIEPTILSATVTSADVELRLYELAHLTGHDELAREVASVSAQTSFPDAAALDRLTNVESRRDQVDRTTESLLSAMRDLLFPPYAEDVQRLVHLGAGTVAIVASPAQHDWLRVFLEGAAAFDGLVDIQTRIYDLAQGELAGLSQSRSGRVLSQPQVEVLLMSLDALQAEMVQAPRVLVNPFQEATLTAVDELAYIKDYELKVIPDQQLELVDPVIGVAQSGIVMRLRCVPLANGELSIDAQLDYSKLAQPIPSVQTTLGAGGHEVTVQVPEITTIKIEGRFRVFSGQTLVMASVDPEGDREVLVLVRVVRVPAIRPGIGEDR